MLSSVSFYDFGNFRSVAVNIRPMYKLLYLLHPRKRLRSIVINTSVCLSACSRGYLRNHTRFKKWCMLPMTVTRSLSGRVTKSQGEWVILGVFFPIDNVTTHTKTAEPIEVPFGMMSGLGPRNSVLRGGNDTEGERQFLGKHMPDKPITPLWIAIWTGLCSGVHMIGADTWLQALDESIIGREGEMGLHTAGEVWYLRLPGYNFCKDEGSFTSEIFIIRWFSDEKAVWF